ncbi:MAG: D-serine deaminase-like pyridoxal phosphate-dependent protein [Chlamydiales bacterium]|jgi:D-serine deaminase-like pyridoxal phosphate-dependent protein
MPKQPFDSLDPGLYALPEDFQRRFLTPALVIDLDRVRANLAWMKASMGGDLGRWRPHVKTTKIPAIFAEIAAAGVRHFKAATTRETSELLASLRAQRVESPDVCLAYPLRGAALTRLGQLATAYPQARISVLVEDEQALAQVPEQVGVFIDVNPGMNRTGIPSDDRDRMARLAEVSGQRLRGLHFYDGHLHSGTEAQRRRRAWVGYDLLLELLAHLGLADRSLEIITSGTPTFLHALAYPGFDGLGSTQHRISPGTVVYHDLRSHEENPGLDLTPAALVVAQIISHPTGKLATCDAGSKSIAAEAGDPCAAVLGRPEWVPQTPSEEHLPLRIEHGALPARGTLVQLIPRHVCPTVNLAEEAVLIEAGQVREVVPVSARAHELRAH